MAEKMELDKATDELRKAEQQFSNYWKQASDLNKILFNIEIDKIYRSFKVKCAQLRIEDKINSLKFSYKEDIKSIATASVFYIILLIIYTIFFRDDNDGVSAYLVILGIIALNFFLYKSRFDQHKNMLMISAHMFDPIADYALRPGPTKHHFTNRHGNPTDRFMIIQSHLLFNYINYDLGDSDLEKIQIETEIVRYRIKLLYNIETEMSDSKPLQQREESWNFQTSAL